LILAFLVYNIHVDLIFLKAYSLHFVANKANCDFIMNVHHATTLMLLQVAGKAFTYRFDFLGLLAHGYSLPAALTSAGWNRFAALIPTLIGASLPPPPTSKPPTFIPVPPVHHPVDKCSPGPDMDGEMVTKAPPIVGLCQYDFFNSAVSRCSGNSLL